MKNSRKIANLFLGLWVILASFSLPTAQLKAASPSTTKLCSAKLHQALTGEAPVSRNSLRTLKDYHEAQMRMSAILQIEWSRLSKNDLETDEHFFWIRENGIRDINTLAGMALTERYLLLKAWHITRILENNPEWGRLVHRNFKDMVIVTKLTPDEFISKINHELRAALEQDMRSFGNQGLSYVNVLMQYTSYGYSKSFEGAHLKANKLDINTWRKETTELRREIKHIWEQQESRAEEDSSAFLVEIFKVKKKAKITFGKNEIEVELRRFGINSKDIEELSQKIEKYFELIQGADMLPPPDTISHSDQIQVEAWLKSGKSSTKRIQALISRRPWTQRHALFFKSAYEKNITDILALDIRGFGVESFAIRDRFILHPRMQRQDLSKIYENSTKWLDNFFTELVNAIKKETGITVVADFRSGDDALFALDPQTTPQQKNKLRAYLRDKRKDLYFSLATKKSTDESLSLLIDLARTGVNQYKDTREMATEKE